MIGNAIREALEPCPFCGGKVKLGHVRDGARVSCQAVDCLALGPPEFHGRLDQPSAQDRAIAAWNRRARTAYDAIGSGVKTEHIEAFRTVLESVLSAETSGARSPAVDFEARRFIRDHGAAILASLSPDDASAADAEIGRDFLNAIEAARDEYPWLADWTPAERYSELITDLLDIAFPALSPAVEEADAKAGDPGDFVLVPRKFLEFVKHAPVRSGTCCCGDDMAQHSDPMSCGHAPVDMWDHTLSGWLEQILAFTSLPSIGSGVKALEREPTADMIAAGGRAIEWCKTFTEDGECDPARIWRVMWDALSTHTAAGAGPVGEAVAGDLETRAWNCADWPTWLFEIIDKTNEAADRLDMSSEQAHAFAALSALAARPVEEPGEVERLRAEGFALAANQCRYGYGDEHGHHRCAEIDRLTREIFFAKTALAGMRERLEKALAYIEEAIGCFDAAYSEGMAERLAEAREADGFDPASAAGIFERRVSFVIPALELAREALTGDAQEAGR